MAIFNSYVSLPEGNPNMICSGKPLTTRSQGKFLRSLPRFRSAPRRQQHVPDVRIFPIFLGHFEEENWRIMGQSHVRNGDLLDFNGDTMG